MREITERPKIIGRMILICCAVSMMFHLFVTFMISKSFSGRIRAIADKMQDIKKGNFSVRVEEVSRDELGFLARVFNDMSEKIENLIRDNYQANLDKKDAQLRALQSQINPHFLYNSMSAISRLAESGARSDIITMVKSLAKFYRMTLSNGTDIIRISDELEHVKAYIEVFRIRKGDLFETVYEIDETALGYYTVKVIIQPFVENIFEHAMGTGTGDKLIRISISVKRCNGNIIFNISDNGAGIPENKLHLLLKSEGSGNNGYGIRNVNERIKLYFGNEYGVKIDSRLGEGTTVTVIIPEYQPGGSCDSAI